MVPAGQVVTSLHTMGSGAPGEGAGVVAVGEGDGDGDGDGAGASSVQAAMSGTTSIKLRQKAPSSISNFLLFTLTSL